MTRLVAVSNRVTESTKGAGGLAVGVLAAMKSLGGLWFGWSGKMAADDTVRVARRDNIEFATFDLPRRDFDLYYAGFCNGTLWPLCHYFVTGLRYSRAEFDAYVRVNRLFAEQLAPLLRDDDLVWVHDYHLMHLGRELRACGVTRPLGFFLHIPFPHIEALRALPRYGDLIRALLEFDVVGFQTTRDIECFRSAVVDVLGASALYHDEVRQPRGRTRLGVFPIGVDVDVIRREARQVTDVEDREAHERGPARECLRDRRRPARLQQRARGALRGVRDADADTPGASRSRELPANCAALALRYPGLPHDPQVARADRGPDQRRVRGD